MFSFLPKLFTFFAQYLSVYIPKNINLHNLLQNHKGLVVTHSSWNALVLNLIIIITNLTLILTMQINEKLSITQ